MNNVVEVIESSTSGAPPAEDVRARLDATTIEVRRELHAWTRKGQACVQHLALQQQNRTAGSVDISALLQLAKELRDDCLQWQQKARQRAIEIRSSLTNHTDGGDAEYIESILSQPPWSACETGGSVAVGVMSDVHRAIRELQTSKTTTPTTTWSAPKTFVRETHKYWVSAPHRLEEVLLACAGELPLLVYGRKDGALFDPNEIMHSEEEIWDRFATPISSIYFDTFPAASHIAAASNTNTFSLYHERLRRTEGAQLLRVRWYGTDPPRGTEPLFVELKTHHEMWVEADSTKERVSVQERHMDKLLSPLNGSNRNSWTLDDARSIAKAGDPSLHDTALEAAADLLLRIRALVTKGGGGRIMRPCVRTCYSRVSFQSSDSNALRLTVDRNVRVYDESTAPMGAWCRPNNARDATPMATIPCAIFEVKLAGRPTPVAVEQLEWSGVIRSAHKFSKFLTGVSVLHTSRLRQLPYWAREPLFHSMYSTDSNSSSRSRRLLATSPDADVFSHQNSSRKTVRTDEIQSADSLSSGMEEEPSNATTGTRQQFRGSLPLFSLPSRFSLRSSQRKHGYVLENADLESNDGDHGLEHSKNRSTRSNSMFRRYSSMRGSTSSTKSIAPSKRARIEPKTYFAAERTYIQWISAALLLVTVASVLNALAVETTLVTERIMMVLAGMITIYALVIYFRRLYLLERALPYGYQDHAGPIVLTAAILLGILTLLYFSVAQRRDNLAQLATLKIEPGKCTQHSFSGVSILEFQPSDIVVDNARDMFLVPSITEIRSLSKEATNDSLRMLHTLAVVNHEDIEAMTFHDDGTLYAVSEDPQSSILLAFRWSTPVGSFNHALELVGRWKLKGVANTEGMVFLPEDPVHAKPQRLLISSDASDPLRSNVHIFDVPTLLTLDEPELHAVSHLNSALLSSGFESLVSTKIAAMTAFEGVVYVLHDNVRVIRGWDVVTGTMVSEWMTPRVGGEFDKQWEGISLERIDASTVALHMALDTPPQIWTFVLEETHGAKGGAVWRLPECAQAF